MKVNIRQPDNMVVNVNTDENDIKITNVNQTSTLRSKVSTDDDRVVINEGGVQLLNTRISEILQNLNVSIIPASNNSVSLGNSSLTFSSIYLSGNAIYLGNGVISSTDDGIIQLSGFDVDFGDVDLSLLRLTDVIDSGLVNNSVMVYDEDSATFSFSLVDEDNLDVSNTYILEKLLSVDGIGSNLDADKLDGFQSTYYLHANNLTFSNTVNVSANNYTINDLTTLLSKRIYISSPSSTVVDQFSINSLRAAKYQITMSDSNDTTYYTSEILLIHNNTESGITIYGEVIVGSNAEIYPVITSDVQNDNVRLIVTTNSDDITLTVHRSGTII